MLSLTRRGFSCGRRDGVGVQVQRALLLQRNVEAKVYGFTCSDVRVWFGLFQGYCLIHSPRRLNVGFCVTQRTRAALPFSSSPRALPFHRSRLLQHRREKRTRPTAWRWKTRGREGSGGRKRQRFPRGRGGRRRGSRGGVGRPRGGGCRKGYDRRRR